MQLYSNLFKKSSRELKVVKKNLEDIERVIKMTKMSIRLFPSFGGIIYKFLTLNDFMISLMKQDFLTNCKTFFEMNSFH